MALYRCIAVRCCLSMPAAWFHSECSVPEDWTHRKPLGEAWALTAQLELDICAMSPPLCFAGVFGKRPTPSESKQSTLSRGIAQLEARLGVILFELHARDDVGHALIFGGG